MQVLKIKNLDPLQTAETTLAVGLHGEKMGGDAQTHRAQRVMTVVAILVALVAVERTRRSPSRSHPVKGSSQGPGG